MQLVLEECEHLITLRTAHIALPDSKPGPPPPRGSALIFPHCSYLIMSASSLFNSIIIVLPHLMAQYMFFFFFFHLSVSHLPPYSLLLDLFISGGTLLAVMT